MKTKVMALHVQQMLAEQRPRWEVELITCREPTATGFGEFVLLITYSDEEDPISADWWCLSNGFWRGHVDGGASSTVTELNPDLLAAGIVNNIVVDVNEVQAYQ